MNRIGFLIFFFTSFILLRNIHSAAVDKFLERDLTITQNEKQDLDKLLISMEEQLTHDYMKTEIYLSRWLRAADSDLDQAKKMLQQHLRWREVNKVDSIAQEDFHILKDQFPVHTDAVDYFGAPVMTLNVQDWDIRRGALSGQGDKIHRYLISRLEEISGKLRAAQEEGLNVTRVHLIEDLQGYNLIQHACLPCLSVQIRWISDLQIQYPGLMGNIVYINASPVFEAALRTILPIVGAETRNSIKIFGTNRKEWESFISEWVSPDQLETNYGGTKGKEYF